MSHPLTGHAAYSAEYLVTSSQTGIAHVSINVGCLHPNPEGKSTDGLVRGTYYVGRAVAPPIWVLGSTKCRWDSTLPIPLKSRPPLVRDACTRLIIVLHDSSTVAAPWHPKHDPDEANARKPDKSRKVTPKC